MKRISRIMTAVVCFSLVLISWLVTANSKSAAQRQLDLINRAATLVQSGIFIGAMPLLEEAAGIDAALTISAEEALKKVYLELIDNRQFARRYINLLEKQMYRKDADPGVFAEAALYYLSNSKIQEALPILRTGIERTMSPELVRIYEDNRYAFEMSRTSYEHVAAISGTTVQVQSNGLWGIATADGILAIPCEYEKISTFSSGRAIVIKDGEIYAVDRNNNRVAKLFDDAEDFGNFADDRIPIRIDGTWRRAMGDLVPGTMEFQQFGMYSNGYAAAKTNGKWGVINVSSQWLIPPEYDRIIQDELGRCYARGAVFVGGGDGIRLIVDNKLIGSVYEDARPFTNEGYAAVKSGGKWGFIDLTGTIVIDFQFEDALSFGQHLAAVKLNGLWGYISMSGNIVIEPEFIEAKSFSSGSAPVLTGRGWQFITLLEYKKGVTL